MARKKWGITLDGFNDLMSNLDSLGGSIIDAVEKCLKSSQEHVAEKLQRDMRKHKRSGATGEAIVTNKPVKWQGTKASVSVGFDFPEGLASVFLMYGTPRHKKDTKLYGDVYGNKTKKEIEEIHSSIIAEEIRRAMGG